MDLNKVMIIGRLTRDPELKTIPNGTSVTNFAIATNRVYTDRNGVKQELVEFHEIVMWRRLAEIATQYLKKGGKVYIEGRLQTRSWDDPNGFKRYKTEVVADNMIMLDSPRGGAAPQPTAPTNAQAAGAVQSQAPTQPVAGPQTASIDQTPEPREEEIPTIDVDDDITPNAEEDEEEVSVEDIPF